jgi:hypothetical protein
MSTNKSKNIIVEVTQEQYDEQIASGLSEDEVLKPGRHIFRRGGFRERHPNFSLENIEIRVTNSKQDTTNSTEKDKEKKAA